MNEHNEDNNAADGQPATSLTEVQIDEKVASFFNRPIQAIWQADDPSSGQRGVGFTSDEVRASLAAVIEEVTGIDPTEVTLDKDLIDELGIDSLSAAEIAVRLDDLYDFCMRQEGLVGLRTVGDAVDYLHHAMSIDRAPPRV